MDPLASVVIPNWNGAHHLPVCLDALRAQTYPHTEVILVDNGSTDGSLALVRERYPEVLLLALDRNLGLTGGNNAGFRAARGDVPVEAITTDQWPRAAEPPLYAPIVNFAGAALGIVLRPWQEALRAYFEHDG